MRNQFFAASRSSLKTSSPPSTLSLALSFARLRWSLRRSMRRRDQRLWVKGYRLQSRQREGYQRLSLLSFTEVPWSHHTSLIIPKMQNWNILKTSCLLYVCIYSSCQVMIMMSTKGTWEGYRSRKARRKLSCYWIRTTVEPSLVHSLRSIFEWPTATSHATLRPKRASGEWSRDIWRMLKEWVKCSHSSLVSSMEHLQEE